MNQSYTGTVGGYEGQVKPIEIEIPASEHRLEELSDEDHGKLVQYLTCRLNQGNVGRDARLRRYAKIDKLISTWQQLNAADSQREQAEENTGRQQALPMNLPLLATQLDDTTAFFAEVFVPMAGAFFTSQGTPEQKALADKMNQDAKIRNHYSQVALTIRSLLKYNIGGFHVEWEDSAQQSSVALSKGNRWISLNMYNTLWDTTISDVSKVSEDGEWAATVEQRNRVFLIRKGLSKEYHRIKSVFACEEDNKLKPGSNHDGAKKVRYYKHPPSSAGIPTDGSDDKTAGNQTNNVDWASFGAAYSHENMAEIQGYEEVTMYCWLVPDSFGLLSSAEADELESMGVDLNSYLELWKFKLIDGETVVYAEPAVPRKEAIQSSSVSETSVIGGQNIPIHIGLMNQDQTGQAQRSVMELMRGFQRFASYLANIYIAGMRKNVWGLTGIDTQMFDASKISEGDVAGVMKSKIPGRDVRTGLLQLNNTSGVDSVIHSLDAVFAMVQRFFPAQGAPAQVAGIDRATKDQVATVMQGSTRRLHMLARLLDAVLFAPARITAWKNLNRFDSEKIKGLSDEEVAKVIGSGIQALESERIAAFLLEIIYALMQNPEAAQNYDMAAIFAYVSRLKNLDTDLGQFVKQQPQANPGAAAEGAPTEGAEGAEGGGAQLDPSQLMSLMGG